MLAADFPKFEIEVRRLEKLFGKAIDNDVIQSYWFALKDQQFEVFQKFVQRHERHGRFFPKPSELRAKEDRLPEVPGGKEDSSFKDGEARCIRNLEELRGSDSEGHRREVGKRQLDRIIATQHPGSSLYEAALNEWHSQR